MIDHDPFTHSVRRGQTLQQQRAQRETAAFRNAHPPKRRTQDPHPQRPGSASVCIECSRRATDSHTWAPPQSTNEWLTCVALRARAPARQVCDRLTAVP
eukprot:5455000-Prymnesium_polylepis.1